MTSVTVTGGCELSAGGRAYLHDCLAELKERHRVLTDAELVAKTSGKTHVVTITGTMPRHGHCESRGEGGTLHDAVNAAVSRFDARLRKAEDRLHDHRHEPLKSLEAASEVVDLSEEEEELVG